jgi:YlmC/YmxH family sporulation protein
MGVFMRISELQSKDIVNVSDGKNIGRIIDIDINDDGSINYLIVESKKFVKRISLSNSEISIKMTEIVKIGKDVILVKLP